MCLPNTRGNGVIVLQAVVLSVKYLTERSLPNPRLRESRERSLNLRLAAISGAKRQLLSIGKREAELLGVVICRRRSAARCGVITKDTSCRRQRKQLINDVETDRVDDRSALSVNVQIQAIARDWWSITTWHCVIEDLNRTTEESEHVWVGKQFSEITRSHS